MFLRRINQVFGLNLYFGSWGQLTRKTCHHPFIEDRERWPFYSVLQANDWM